ncbi:hypothetical protein CBOM_04344 [Ceraceosorus bombacis]|uniref:Uncharacterized protein n=1 Tax=Ceraceosorus bombacis TaxID=401625 RepID=A0A0P1BIP1_9BASI|nr:hypothetical protein CBOM_04344 [Ceraceosorus bombacis]
MLATLAGLLAGTSLISYSTLALAASSRHTPSLAKARSGQISHVHNVSRRGVGQNVLSGLTRDAQSSTSHWWRPSDMMPKDPATGIRKVHPSWNLPEDYNEKAAQRDKDAGKALGSSITDFRERLIWNGEGRPPTIEQTRNGPKSPPEDPKHRYVHVPSSREELEREWNDPHPALHPVHEYRKLTRDKYPVLRESKSSSDLLYKEPTKPSEVPKNAKTGLERSKSTSALIDESPLKMPKGRLPSDAERRHKLMHQFVQSYPGHIPKSVQDGLYDHAKQHEGRLHYMDVGRLYLEHPSEDLQAAKRVVGHMERWTKHTKNMYPISKRIWSDMHDPIPLTRDGQFFKAAGMPNGWSVENHRGGPNVQKYLLKKEAAEEAKRNKVLTPLEKKKEAFDRRFPQRKLW